MAHRFVQHHRVPAHQSRLHPAEHETVRLHLRGSGRLRRHRLPAALDWDVRCRTIANRRLAKGADMTAAPAPPRLREPGAHLGPLPVINVVVLQIGLALGLALLAVDTALWVAALLVALITVPLALGRWHGR